MREVIQRKRYINLKMLHRKAKRREEEEFDQQECAQGYLCPNLVKIPSMGLEFGVWVNFQVEISHHHVTHKSEMLSKGIFRKKEI